MVRVQRPTSMGSELGPRSTRVMAQSHATRRTVSAVMGWDEGSMSSRSRTVMRACMAFERMFVSESSSFGVSTLLTGDAANLGL
jgi:hypothetical protein